MKKYFKTKGIYNKANLLKVEVKYKKDFGYVAEVTPCYKDNNSCGIIYCEEYYNFYNTLVINIVPSARKNAKKEQEAINKVNSQINYILELYIKTALEKGGKEIEIIGELTD